MSFDSITFWLIIAVAAPLYWFLSHRLQNNLLLALSLLFYGIWDLRYLMLMLGMATASFYLAQAMERCQGSTVRKLVFSLSISISLAPLLFFKYILQVIGSVTKLEGPLFLPGWLKDWGIPIGISFYTFQIMSYTIDVYRRRVTIEKSLARFYLFVTFFPQLVAGPIERARRLIPQISQQRILDRQQIEFGLWLCLWGLFKKMYVANGISYPIESFFHQKNPTDAGCVISIALLSTLMVYADFSGYSDMARGVGKLFGFELSINFKPFWKATNPNEFWQTWNITLTHWLRDYVFLPLRKKNGERRQISRFNILLIMILVGVWHAAKINWLLFGAFNGLLIVLHLQLTQWNAYPKITGFLLLILLIVGNGFLHSTPDLAALRLQIESLTIWNSWLRTQDIWRYAVWFVAPMLVIETLWSLQIPQKPKWFESLPVRVAIFVICFTGIVFLERSSKAGFIYFQF